MGKRATVEEGEGRKTGEGGRRGVVREETHEQSRRREETRGVEKEDGKRAGKRRIDGEKSGREN